MSQTSPDPNSEARAKFVPPPFLCECKADGFGSVRIHLEGELDLANVSEFGRELQAAQSEAKTVSLDLQELALVDCSALKEILEADASARLTGGKLILVRGSGQVDRVLALTGVLERIEVVDLRPTEGSRQGVGGRPSTSRR
jgi:anti-anti-sigma factor